MKKIGIILTLSLAAPIWFWLLYQILERVNASELMWFLYWVYLPVALLASTLIKAAEDKK